MNELERIERKVLKEDGKVIAAFMEYVNDLSPKAQQHVLSGVTKSTTELRSPLTLTAWEEQGATLAHQHSTATPWAIADWLLLSERVGMGSKYERAAEILGWTPAACRVSACIGRAFPPAERYGALTFAHHAAVAALDAEDRRRLLDKAVEKKLSTRELRAEAKGVAPDPKPQVVEFKEGMLIRVGAHICRVGTYDIDFDNNDKPYSLSACLTTVAAPEPPTPEPVPEPTPEPELVADDGRVSLTFETTDLKGFSRSMYMTGIPTRLSS